MTEESYLPPDVDQPSRSEIVACEANPAQIKDRANAIFSHAALLLVGGFVIATLVDIATDMRIPEEVFLIWLSALALIFLIGFVIWNRDRRRLYATLQEIYPASDGRRFAVIRMDAVQVTDDGRWYAKDHGYLTVEDDCLWWRGAWCQMLLRREDVKSVVISVNTAEQEIFLRADVLGELKKINVRLLPNGRRTVSFWKNRFIRNWHKGKAPA